MKTLYLLFALIAITLCSAQSNEFNNQDDELIYSDEAVKELKHIVDSLNLKFAVCEPKTYYTPFQSEVVYLSVEGEDALLLRSDLDKGLLPDELDKKYADKVDLFDSFAVRHTYKNYKKEDILNFKLLQIGSENSDELYLKGDLFNKYKNVTSGWIYSYNESNKNSPESLTAIYLKAPVEVKAMNDKYARLVQYSDCLIDTTATVYFATADRTGGYFYNKNNGKVNKLLKYIDDRLDRPHFNYKGFQDDIAKIHSDTTRVDSTIVFLENQIYLRYVEEFEEKKIKRLIKIDSIMYNDKRCNKLFKKALQATLSNKEMSNDEFDEYVGRYSSKENELFLKRNRMVIGRCSMDDSPRVHALKIAELAGETANWDIFLRSHLDIMNDRFSRVSDGSYAWAGRKTYIKELEVLDINVTDLLLGIVLRVDNPSDNHYFGSIERIGRSLAEAENRDVIENRILDMIKDDELDSYNRVLMYYLFLYYNYSLHDELQQEFNKIRIEEAISYLPSCLKNLD